MGVITPGNQGFKYAKIRVETADQDHLIIEGVPNKRICVLGYAMYLSKGGDLLVKDTAGTVLSELVELPSKQILNYAGGAFCPAFEGAVGEGIVLNILNISGGKVIVTGNVTYKEV